MKGPLFYSLLLSFFAGIFLAGRFVMDWQIALFLFFISFLITLYFVLIKKSTVFFCVIICSFSFGLWRSSISGVHEHIFDKSIGKNLILKGIICTEPEKKDTSQRFCFKPDNSVDNIIVSADRYPEYMYGDKLIVKGSIEFPENFFTYEGGPEFDYISYLGKDDIRYVMKMPKIEILERGKGNWIVMKLINTKDVFMGNINNSMPEPHASLVAGLLLGEKGSLPKDVGDNFRRSGLTHILVLSGSNVSIVAESLVKIFSFLPRVFGQWVGAISIILFALMTGASSTTIRASIMALVVILARGVSRRYDVTRTLSLAAFFMVIQNPRILDFDIGFQLSFLATLALIYVSPIVTEWLGFIPEKYGFREILVTTVSTQIFTLPFILHSMGEISIISLITNVLVLPCVAWAMLGGFIVGIFGFVHPIIALPFVITTAIIISFMIAVVNFFGPLPFSTYRLSVGEPVIAVIYFLYILFIWRWRKRRKNSFQQ